MEQDFEIVAGTILRKASQLITKEENTLYNILNRNIRHIEKSLFQKESEIDMLIAQINLSNPTHILKMGYARVFQDGRRLKSKTEISLTQTIVLQLHDGTVHAQPTQNQ